MSIVNRRNAMLGWTTWQVTKHVARKKARKEARDGRPKKLTIGAAGAAALAGSVLFWRKARKRTEAAEGEGGGGGG